MERPRGRSLVIRARCVRFLTWYPGAPAWGCFRTPQGQATVGLGGREQRLEAEDCYPHWVFLRGVGRAATCALSLDCSVSGGPITPNLLHPEVLGRTPPLPWRPYLCMWTTFLSFLWTAPALLVPSTQFAFSWLLTALKILISSLLPEGKHFIFIFLNYVGIQV